MSRRRKRWYLFDSVGEMTDSGVFEETGDDEADVTRGAGVPGQTGEDSDQVHVLVRLQVITHVKQLPLE